MEPRHVQAKPAAEFERRLWPQQQEPVSYPEVEVEAVLLFQDVRERSVRLLSTCRI